MTPSEPGPPRLGEILVQNGLIGQENVESALAHARDTGLRLGEALVALGFLDSDKVTWALGIQLDLSYVDVQPDMVDWDLVTGMPLERLQAMALLPINSIGNQVLVVVADPAAQGLAATVRELFPFQEVTLNLATEEQIHGLLTEAHRRAEHHPGPADAEPRAVHPAQSDDPLGRLLAEETDTGLVWGLPGEHTARFVCRDRTNTELSAPAVLRLSERLLREFTIQQEFPGGFSGIRAPHGTNGEPCLRGLTVQAPAGWLMLLQRVPGLEPAPAPAPPLLCGAEEPMDAKRALLAALEARGQATGLPPVCVELHLQALAPGVLQAGIADDRLRLAVAADLADAGLLPAVAVEADTAEQVTRLAAIAQGVLFVLWRGAWPADGHIAGLPIRPVSEVIGKAAPE